MTAALITGGAGFIGSHLADRLVADGRRVVAFDNLAIGRLANIEQVPWRERFSFVWGAARSPNSGKSTARTRSS